MPADWSVFIKITRKPPHQLQQESAESCPLKMPSAALEIQEQRLTNMNPDNLLLFEERRELFCQISKEFC